MPVLGKTKDEPVKIDDLQQKEEIAEKTESNAKKNKEDEEQQKLPERDLVNGKFGERIVESLGNEFMVCNHNTIKFEPNITHNNILYLPRQQAPYAPYSRPEKLDKPDVQELYEEVYKVFDDFVEVKEDYKHLLATSVFFTYQQNKSHTTPYLYFVGEKGSGKTRVLEILEYLAYRPLLAASISGPNVIQFLEDGPVGIVLDDEIADSLNYDSDKRSIYKSGYRASGKVPKIVIGSDGRRKQIFFNSYSFKAFSSKSLVEDDQIVRRCIIVPMVQGSPHYAGILPDEDLPRFQKIRNKLLLWKLYTCNENYLKERPKTSVDELFLPLLKTAKFTGNKEAYDAMIRIKDHDRIEREEEIRSTLEAKILIGLVKLNNEKSTLTFSFKEIFNKLCEVVNGKIEENRIISGEFVPITKALLGRRLKDIFKGKQKQMWYCDEYVQCYTFDVDILNKQISVYNIRTEDIKKDNKGK